MERRAVTVRGVSAIWDLKITSISCGGAREPEPKEASVVSSRGRWLRRGSWKKLLLRLRESQRGPGIDEVLCGGVKSGEARAKEALIQSQR